MCNIYLQQLKARVNRDNPRTQSLQNTYMYISMYVWEGGGGGVHTCITCRESDGRDLFLKKFYCLYPLFIL